MKREKNSLSATMRNAWDGHEKLQTMTKDSRNFATKAHLDTREHYRRGAEATA
jgi:hypothetical protein